MLDEVRAKVRHSGMTYEEIAAGANVSASWLEKMMCDKRGDYGIKKCLRVVDWIDSRQPHQSAIAAPNAESIA